jgi:hypothetical protein
MDFDKVTFDEVSYYPRNGGGPIKAIKKEFIASFPR